MTEEQMPSTEARPVDVELFLKGGHHHQLTLLENSNELRELFAAMVAGQASLIQLPMKEGRAALSFRAAELVSVITNPPVLLQLDVQEPPALPAEAAPDVVEPTPFAVVDNFLSPDEEQALLNFALTNKEHFEPGTTDSKRTIHRENMVILSFGHSVEAKLLQNRLLTWFPVLTKAIGEPVFPLASVESQLTANNDGHYYRLHDDAGHGETAPRTMTCVYYLHRQPRGHSGGELRLYDTVVQGESRVASKSFRVFEPHSNRLVVFPSGAFHEVCPVRCPSREFEDSRFSVTTWIHRGQGNDRETRFGWGQMRCGVVPENFA